MTTPQHIPEWLLNLHEILNGSWFLLNAAMLLALSWFLWQNWNLTRLWKKYPPIQVAVGLWVYMLGATLFRLYAWGAFIVLGTSGDGIPMDTYYIAAIGSVIGVIGGLCCVRVWTFEAWGRWPWIVAGVLAVGVPVLVHHYF